VDEELEVIFDFVLGEVEAGHFELGLRVLLADPLLVDNFVDELHVDGGQGRQKGSKRLRLAAPCLLE